MRPKTPGKSGVVLEFKVLEEGEAIDPVLEDAAQQIRERDYAAEVRAGGASVVFEYAMVFDGKRAWVKRVEDVEA